MNIWLFNLLWMYLNVLFIFSVQHINKMYCAIQTTHRKIVLCYSNNTQKNCTLLFKQHTEKMYFAIQTTYRKTVLCYSNNLQKKKHVCYIWYPLSWSLQHICYVLLCLFIYTIHNKTDKLKQIIIEKEMSL